jgi:hypothetical protein
MKVIQDDLWLCQDCTIYSVNGDTSGIDSEEREKEVVEGVNALGPHLVPDFDSETNEGIEEFSRRQCDACGTRLGGSRDRFAILGEESPEDDHQRHRIGARRPRKSRENVKVMSAENPISDLSWGEIALITAGVGVLGYIVYSLWNATDSSGADAAQAWQESQATGASGLPQGVGQFQQIAGGTAPVGGTDWATQQTYGPGNPVTVETISASDSRVCGNGGTTGYCDQDQGNTTVPSVGDTVAIILQNEATGNTYPFHGTVQSTDGQTVTFVDSQGIGWNYPLSFVLSGPALVAAYVGL